MSSNSYLFLRPPVWKQQFWGSSLKAPAGLQSWLDETGSLTKRLRSVYGTGLTVRILFHRWKPAFTDESRSLSMPPQRYQLIREVLLYAQAKPLILARTVLPESTITIAHRNLSHLGTRPLGEVIFAYPDLERRQRTFCHAAPHCWSSAVNEEFGIEQPLWGRRTLYAIHDQPLLVSEFFLPELLTNLATQKE